MKTPSELQTAADFLEFFEAIPEEKWCEGEYINPRGQCCASGHLGEREWTPLGDADEAPRRRLANLIGTHSVPDLNDGRNEAFPQPTPKARICAALRDAIAKGK